MPIDPSIITQGVTPIRMRSPLESLMTVQQMQYQREALDSLTDQREAAAEARRQQIALKAQADAENQALKALYGSGQPVTIEQVAGIVGPDRAAKIDESFTALHSKRREALGSIFGGVDSLPPGELRDQYYREVRAQAIRNGWATARDLPEREVPGVVQRFVRQAMSPDKLAEINKPVEKKTRQVEITNQDGSKTIQIVEDVAGQTFTSAPDAPKVGSFEDYLAGYAKSLGRTVAQLSPTQKLQAKAQWDSAGRAPIDDRIVQVMGEGGVPIWVKESDAVGRPAAQAARAVTGQERKDLGFYNRALEASRTLDGLESWISKLGLGGQTRLEYGGNLLQTDEGQAYRQAQRAFTEARLRKESGAAIAKSEYENDARTYFAQPGDSAATLEQKRKARQTVLQGLAYGAGKAYDEYYGEPLARPGAAKPDSKPDLVYDPKTKSFRKP